jgi:hypothetical protein
MWGAAENLVYAPQKGSHGVCGCVWLTNADEVIHVDVGVSNRGFPLVDGVRCRGYRQIGCDDGSCVELGRSLQGVLWGDRRMGVQRRIGNICCRFCEGTEVRWAELPSHWKH